MNSDESGIHVFRGPTLSQDEGLTLRPDAVFHAPIQSGDLMQLLSRTPKMVVIIDGVYENKPSIWHKEILTAISHGVTVMGCSSMGALRAAELSRHGMIGHGKIYQQYQDGSLTDDDDEVAVAHFDHTLDYVPHNQALINIRYTLQRATKEHILTHHHAQILIDILKKTFYWKRSIELALKHSSLPVSIKDPLIEWWPSHWVDQKKEDAKDTLNQLSNWRTNTPMGPPTKLTVQSLNLFKQHTIHFNRQNQIGILEKHIAFCLLTIKHVTPKHSPHPLFEHYINWTRTPHEPPHKMILDELIANEQQDIHASNVILGLYHYPRELKIDNHDKSNAITQCLRQQLWRVISKSYTIAQWNLNPIYLQQYITQYRQLKQIQTDDALTACLKKLNLTLPQWEDTMNELAYYKYLITDSRLCYFELTKDHFKTNWSEITQAMIQSYLVSID